MAQRCSFCAHFLLSPRLACLALSLVSGFMHALNHGPPAPLMSAHSKSCFTTCAQPAKSCTMSLASTSIQRPLARFNYGRIQATCSAHAFAHGGRHGAATACGSRSMASPSSSLLHAQCSAPSSSPFPPSTSLTSHQSSRSAHPTSILAASRGFLRPSSVAQALLGGGKGSSGSSGQGLVPKDVGNGVYVLMWVFKFYLQPELQLYFARVCCT